MKVNDLIKMSLGNLKRTKLRAFLTTSGVIIGIGALISMVSFGTGIQKNIADAMAKLEVFTFIEVLPRKLALEDMMARRRNNTLPEDTSTVAKVITDSTISQIAALPHVNMVYPDVFFPAKIKLGAHDAMTTVQALPARMKNHSPFNKLAGGTFFNDDSVHEAIVSTDLLKRLKVHQPDSALGMTIQLVTAKVDLSKFALDFSALTNLDWQRPFAEEVTEFRIVGVWKKTEFSSDFMRSVIIPIATSRTIPRLEFKNVFDLLRSFTGGVQGYPSLQVKVAKIEKVEAVQQQIEAMGYGTMTFATQLAEMRKGFLFMDAALGTVGTIALIVAALGIINTMVMSVLERYREIGVMKAIGATDGEIKTLFFFESSVIGLFGGVLGIILGWIVTRIANSIGNYFIMKQGGSPLELFYIPWWLILGGVAFAIGVSLLAGIYPASRAARVDPVKALRHE